MSPYQQLISSTKTVVYTSVYSTKFPQIMMLYISTSEKKSDILRHFISKRVDKNSKIKLNLLFKS